MADRKRNRRRGRAESQQKIAELRGDVERLAILLRQSDGMLKKAEANARELGEQLSALRRAIEWHEGSIVLPTKPDRKLWVVLRQWGDPASGSAAKVTRREK